MRLNTADPLFIPPHAPPLTGEESFVRSTYKFIRNPLEGFGPLSYSQPITSVKTFGVQTHVITDPVGMAEILTLNANKFSKAPIDARILGPATKEGLLSVHGDQWKRQRRAVAPIFAHRHMANLAPMIADVTRDFEARLGAGAEVELNAAMADLTFDVLAKALLGDPQGLDRDTLKLATRRVVKSAGTLRPDDLIPFPRGVPRPIGPKGYAALRRLKKAAGQLLKTREGQAPTDDLVGLLTSAVDPHTGEPLSQIERRDNLIGFFIAGHETTALTLTWALYLIAMDRTAQARILTEVHSIRPQDDVTYEDMQKLSFTRAVIDETLRLFPPAPLFNRECKEVCTVLGREIKPKDVMLLAPYVMHRTERLWDDPLSFDPDRFLRNPELRGKGAPYMPFGAGPRICVGAAFALMEAVMALATLVRDYDVSVPEGTFPRPFMTITLRPQGGIRATLTRR